MVEKTSENKARKESLDRVAARTEQHPEKSSLGVRVTST